MAKTYLSDDEVFGTSSQPIYLSDEEVFGISAAGESVTDTGDETARLASRYKAPAARQEAGFTDTLRSAVRGMGASMAQTPGGLGIVGKAITALTGPEQKPTPAQAPAPVASRPEPAPYRDRQEALDDAVNLLEEGADRQVVADSFGKIGVRWDDIVNHGRTRGSEHFNTTQPTEADREVGRLAARYPAPQQPQGEMRPWEPTAVDEVLNVGRRGLAQMDRERDIRSFQLGLIDSNDLAIRLRENQRRMGAASPSGMVADGIDRLQRANESGDTAATASAILDPRNWPGLAAIIGESAIPSAASVPAIAAGQLIGGPAGGFSTAALASFSAEYANAVTETLQKRGIDPSDSLSVARALEDPGFLKEASERGMRRGVPVAVFDGISAGFAGRFMRALERQVASTGTAATRGQVAGALGKEAALQVGSGVAGEGIAQAMVGEYKPLDIAVEGLAELPGGLVEVAAGTARSGSFNENLLPKSREQQIAEAIQQNVDSTQWTVPADQIARDRLSPSTVNFTPADSLTKQAGLPDIEVPVPVQPAGGLINGAADVPAVEAGAVPATGVARREGLATDQELLARLPEPQPQQQPVTIWTGRAGDGYATEEDARRGLETRMKREPDLRWEVEQMPSGKYRLAGYEQSQQPATQETNLGATPQQQLAPQGQAMDPTAAATAAGSPARQVGAVQGVGPAPALPGGAAQDGGVDPATLTRDLQTLQDAVLRQFKRPVKLQVIQPSDSRTGLAAVVARIFRAPITFVRDQSGRPLPFGGIELGGRMYITETGDNAPLASAMHEVFHTLPEDIKQETIRAVMQTVTPEQRANFLKEFSAYRGKTASLQDEELVARIIQQDAQNPQFWERIAARLGDNEFGRLAREILRTLDRIIAGFRRENSSEFTTDIERVRDIVADAYARSLERQRAAQAPTVTQPAPAGDAPVAGAETTRPTQVAPPTDFWSFAKSKGYKPGDIKVGTPEHAALKAEYDALRQGQTAERPSVEPLNNLPDPALQNRDRSRAASVVQMSEIARNPDYMRLGPSRTPDSGAPMVFAVGDDVSRIPAENFGRQDVAVMSDGQRVPFRYAVVDASQVNPSHFADGRQNPEFASTVPGTIKALNNGRTAGVRAAYELGTAGQYAQDLAADAALHGVPAEAIARTPSPMLVRVYSERDNTADMAAKSQSQALGLSPAELARQDAPLLDTSVLGVYEPGEITSAANRDFVRAFIGKLQAAGQDVAGMMTGDGQLSQDGRKRIQAALMQAAYGDSDIVEEMFDSTETDIKAIGEALKTMAGQWANMRDSAKLGAINPQTDITQNLIQAIGLIRKARRDGTMLYDLVNQPDLMTGETPDATTVGVLRMFYSGQYMTRAVGKDKLTKSLSDYVTAAMATSADPGMFGDVVTAGEILATINPITEGQSDAEAQPEEGRGQPAGSGDPGVGAGEARTAVGRQRAGESGPGATADRGSEPGQDAAPEAQQQVGQGDPATQEGKAPRATAEQLTGAQERWQRMTTAERQAVAARADGLNPMQRKNLPRAAWADLSADIQRKLADAMGATDDQFDEMERRVQARMRGEPGATYNAEAPRRTYTDDRQLQLFLDNGPDRSQAGARGEAAQREAVAAVDDLRSTETILGLALSRDYAARQRVSLVGQRVSSAEDLAVLAQVYRDPRFETFRVVFVNDSGKVVSQVGLTSRLPTSVNAIMGNDVDAYLRDISATARDRGATGYYLLHNHPSGITTPSRADIFLTTTFASKMPMLVLQEHVVIDTNEYSTIDGVGGVKTLKKDFGQPAPYRAQEWADVKITGPADVMAMAKRLQVDEDAVTLIHTDSQFNVKAISTIPTEATIGDQQQVRRQVVKASLKVQGSQVFAVSRNSAALLRIKGLIRDGIHVSESGQVRSLANEGLVGGGSPFPESRRTRLSPDTSPEFAYLRRQSQPAPLQRVAEPGADQTQTPEFRRWFGDSKVVDEQGRPLVVYHGTNSDLSAFASDRANYFTADPGAASVYAEGFGAPREGANVSPVYLSIQRPKWMPLTDSAKLTAADLAAIKEEGFDGVFGWVLDIRMGGPTPIAREVGTGQRGMDKIVTEAIPLSPEQIKSATGNRGTFDAGSPDIRFSQNRPTVGQRFTLEGSGSIDASRIKVQDEALRLRRVQEMVAKQGGTVGEAQDVYLANTLMPGRVQAMMDQFRDEAIKPLVQKAAQADISMDELALYAYAMHAEGRNRYIASINPRFPDGGSGMKTADARKILADIRASGKQADFDELHRILMAITATTRRIMLEEGLITQEQYDALESQYDHYIPLRGFENVDEETGAIRPGIGRGINVRGEETVKALGRESRAGDLIENVIRDYQRVIMRSERNNVGKVLLNFVLTNPDPDLWEVDAIRTKQVFDKNLGLVKLASTVDKGDNTIGLKVAGVPVYIKIHDPAMLRSLRQLWKDEVSDLERASMALTGWYTTLQRNMLTRYNPAFAAVNIPRDIQSGMVATLDELGFRGMMKFVAKYGYATLASARSELGLKGRNIDRLYEEFKANGGITGGFYLRDVKDIAAQIQNDLLLAGASGRGMTGVKAKVLTVPGMRHLYRAALGIARILEFTGAASENATRFAIYLAARESGQTPAQSARLAKDGTTNFNRKGEIGGTLNAWYLFFNAAVQGNAQLIKVLKNPKVQATMWTIAAGTAALAFYNAGAGGEDDDGELYWDKIPDFEKERNLIIMLEPGDSLGRGINRVGKNGRYIKIPLQYGLNFFPNMGYMVDAMWRNSQDPRQGKTPGKALKHMASVVLGSFNPFGGSFDVTAPAQLAMAAAPTLLDLPIQMAAERNVFGTPVAPPDMPGDVRPDSERMFVSQMDTASAKLAKALNELGGGNEFKSGEIAGIETSFTPGSIDNLVRNVTGGLGVFMMQVVEAGMAAAGQAEPPQTNRIPFVNRFYGEVGESTNIRTAQERMAKVRELAKEVDAQIKNGITPSLDSGEQRLVNLADAEEQIRKEMTALRKEEIAIIQSKTMTDEQKRVARDNILAARDRLAVSFNRTYRESLKIKEPATSQ